MLAELSIHNLVFVERAVIRPGSGLLTISGETGAGKSLLLDAIDLVSGARARSGLVGRWGDAATVAAVFQVDGAHIEDVLGEEIRDGMIILRRRIWSGGRTAAWINDVPVTLTALRAAADHLIALHAQHEPIRLADPRVQLAVLDAAAGLQEQSKAWRTLHRDVQAMERELQAIEGREREDMRELDYLRFQVAALDELSPKAGEYAELESRFQLLTHAAEWRSEASKANALLSEDDSSIAIQLGRVIRRLDGIPNARFADLAQLLRQAQETIRDVGAACSSLAEDALADPGELEAVSGRLDAWNDLLRRHGPDEPSLLKAWMDMRQRIEAIQGGEARAKQLQQSIVEIRARELSEGMRLAEARKKAFEQLSTRVHRHLADLGMPKARLHFRDEPMEKPSPEGVRRQEILVVTNPGAEPGSIRDIASGGEAARLMLALSAALAAADPIPLMVFDEVDSGIGGRLGSVVGRMLLSLAEGRTVIAVTHTPQVAAAGATQLVVRKHQGESETTVSIAVVDGESRVEELTAMLGGGRAAVEQARELLANAGGRGVA